jgi:hypothetical protein
VSFDVHVIYTKIKFDININKYWEPYEIIREKFKGRGSWILLTLEPKSPLGLLKCFCHHFTFSIIVFKMTMGGLQEATYYKSIEFYFLNAK